MSTEAAATNISQAEFSAQAQQAAFTAGIAEAGFAQMAEGPVMPTSEISKPSGVFEGLANFSAKDASVKEGPPSFDIFKETAVISSVPAAEKTVNNSATPNISIFSETLPLTAQVPHSDFSAPISPFNGTEVLFQAEPAPTSITSAFQETPELTGITDNPEVNTHASDENISESLAFQSFVVSQNEGVTVSEEQMQEVADRIQELSPTQQHEIQSAVQIAENAREIMKEVSPETSDQVVTNALSEALSRAGITESVDFLIEPDVPEEVKIDPLKKSGSSQDKFSSEDEVFFRDNDANSARKEQIEDVIDEVFEQVPEDTDVEGREIAARLTTEPDQEQTSGLLKKQQVTIDGSYSQTYDDIAQETFKNADQAKTKAAEIIDKDTAVTKEPIGAQTDKEAVATVVSMRKPNVVYPGDLQKAA